MDIYGLIAVFGILLEIWGFLWLLNYNKIQKTSELRRWAIKNGYGENWIIEIPRETSIIIHDDLDLEVIVEKKMGGLEWRVPIEYYNFIQLRRTWSIVLVITGLFLQILQIVIV